MRLALALTLLAATGANAQEKPLPPTEVLDFDQKALPFVAGQILYRNPLAKPADIAGFKLEGDALVTFPDGRMRLENRRDPQEGQAANFVFWCPQEFPADVEISWNFTPLREPGLAILFFGARGRGGEDLFDPKLKARTGEYQQYHSSDLNALHVSYFRRKAPSERVFNLCNLRKSHGFHLVAQGADPIPNLPAAQGPYRMKITQFGGEVRFWINDLPIFRWEDDGKTYGPLIGGGKIGFRQMAPLLAEYSDLQVRELSKRPEKP